MKNTTVYGLLSLVAPDTRERSISMNADEKAIAAVLASYEQALNQSSTDAVMKL